MEIVNNGYKICICKDNIKYFICLHPPYKIMYSSNKLIIPYVSNLMSMYDTRLISDNYEEIKSHFSLLKDIYKEIPNLKINALIIDDPNKDSVTINFDNGDYLYVTRHYINMSVCNYRINLCINKIKPSNIIFDLYTSNNYNTFSIPKKVEFIGETRDAVSIYDTLKSYVNEHLFILSNLFDKTNVKSAKISN